jgi:two-component SAPR family response regulator
MCFGKLALLIFVFTCISNLTLLADKGRDTLDYNIGGLKFHAQEVRTKERTSLSLFPDYFKINSGLSLSFDCDIYKINCFGYIFRLVGVEGGKEHPILHMIQNPEILHPTTYKLELCTPDSRSDISFLMPVEKQNKLRISIHYIAEQQVVIINCNGIEKSIKGINLNKVKANIVFGNYGIENEDVACMSIRNIRIKKDNKTIYFWPLNEFEGEVAKDKVTGLKSSVRNPVWLRNEHFYWEKLRSFESDAMAGVIFKQKNQQFYFINKDSLLILEPSSDKLEVLEYNNARPFPKHQHFSIYNKLKDQIISYDFKFLKSPPGEKAYSVLNEKTLEWSKVDETTGHLNNHQHTSFWSNDSAFTIFAGYSDFTYFNDLNTFDFVTNTWHAVKMVGDTIFPRTETAIVKDEDANILYVFGGFGNEQGKQVYGGRIYKDLYSVDLSNNIVKKLMDLKNSKLDFLPKGGLIFNNEKTNLYTLMGETSDESFLRLYQINVSNKTVVPVTDSIPFYFGRMESNVYLFKDDLSQYLYCICRECKNSDKSLISIYRIKFPPSGLIEPDVAGLPNYLFFIFLTSVLLVGGLGTGIYYITKKRKGLKKNSDDESVLVLSKQDDKKSELILRKNENAVWFLGEFKLFNLKGKDITYLLPKKSKELFILVYFETIHSNGITTNDLSEMLWPGMDKIHQKNNRGVTVNGVRKVLEEFQGIKLNNVDNLWKIEFEGNCYIDIQEVKKLLKGKVYLTRPDLFISLVSFGNILTNLQFEWLDTIKANYESEILSSLYELCDIFLFKEDYLACLDTANLIHEKYDPLDEIALSFKVTALNKMKGFSKSQNELELFRKRYFATFQEEYKNTVDEVMHLR